MLAIIGWRRIGYVEGFAPSNPKKPILSIRGALRDAIFSDNSRSSEISPPCR